MVRPAVDISGLIAAIGGTRDGGGRSGGRSEDAKKAFRTLRCPRPSHSTPEQSVPHQQLTL